ncbi:helix-turn-helix domain-containing protein [Serratia marcescens]|uniref:helix-turn-helix domain-containing protein n=1 Tax=Serratia marcescens TaxID=615 RepID=UPI001D159E53|nr:LexA family transcriptional regulator [Serratia marcescens]
MRITTCNSNTNLTLNTLGYKFACMKTTLAERLNMAMAKRNNMTQAALAEASGVAQPTIWRLTKGKAKTSGRLVDIANALGVNVDWLANGVGEMEGDTPSITPRIERYSQIPVWDENGVTDDFVISPKGKASPSWKAFILKRNSGCAEAPAGSIVIVDSDSTPGSGDLVVAKVNSSVSAYRFVDGGSHGYLSVDDARVPLIELAPDSLIGVVVLLLRDFRM